MQSICRIDPTLGHLDLQPQSEHNGEVRSLIQRFKLPRSAKSLSQTTWLQLALTKKLEQVRDMLPPPR